MAKSNLRRHFSWFSLFVLVYTLRYSTNGFWFHGDDFAGKFTVRVPPLYASALLGVLSIFSMIAVLAVVIPAMVMTWITILVLLSLAGKTRQNLINDGREMTGEITGYALKTVFREGNRIAAIFALLGFLVLV